MWSALRIFLGEIGPSVQRQNWLTWSVLRIFLSVTGGNRFCKRLYYRIEPRQSHKGVEVENKTGQKQASKLADFELHMWMRLRF
jgi:hypothetical protein